MGTLQLATNATIKDLQKYVADMVVTRGFDQETLEQQFILFLEESGELARAARKHVGIKTAADTAVSDAGEEAADVLLMLLAICNTLGIDLDAAVRAKEIKNQARIWK